MAEMRINSPVAIRDGDAHRALPFFNGRRFLLRLPAFLFLGGLLALLVRLLPALLQLFLKTLLPLFVPGGIIIFVLVILL